MISDWIVEIDYSKDDLIDLLRRHTNKDEKCMCMCPITGNSLEMLIRFVAIEVGEEYISKVKLSKCLEILKELLSNQCIARSRLSVAAGIVYIAGLMTGERRTQAEIRQMFFVSETTIGIVYRDLLKMLPYSMRYIDV